MTPEWGSELRLHLWRQSADGPRSARPHPSHSIAGITSLPFAARSESYRPPNQLPPRFSSVAEGEARPSLPLVSAAGEKRKSADEFVSRTQGGRAACKMSDLPTYRISPGSASEPSPAQTGQPTLRLKRSSGRRCPQTQE